MSSLTSILGGGGGSAEIGEYRLLNLQNLGIPTVYTDTDGKVWLRTGYVDTEVSNYPDFTPFHINNASTTSPASIYTRGAGIDANYVYFYNYSSGVGYKYNRSTKATTIINPSKAK